MLITHNKRERKKTIIYNNLYLHIDSEHQVHDILENKHYIPRRGGKKSYIFMERFKCISNCVNFPFAFKFILNVFQAYIKSKKQSRMGFYFRKWNRVVGQTHTHTWYLPDPSTFQIYFCDHTKIYLFTNNTNFFY